MDLSGARRQPTPYSCREVGRCWTSRVPWIAPAPMQIERALTKHEHEAEGPALPLAMEAKPRLSARS